MAGSGQPEIISATASENGGPETLAALPLTSGGRLVGVMTLTFGNRAEFTADDRLLLEQLNQQAGVAIDGAWLLEISRRQVQELTVLHRVAVAAASRLTVEISPLVLPAVANGA